MRLSILPVPGSRFAVYARYPTFEAAEAVAAVLRADADDDFTYTVVADGPGAAISVADEDGITLGNL
jgi:hypothetical protein